MSRRKRTREEIEALAAPYEQQREEARKKVVAKEEALRLAQEQLDEAKVTFAKETAEVHHRLLGYDFEKELLRISQEINEEGRHHIDANERCYVRRLFSGPVAALWPQRQALASPLGCANVTWETFTRRLQGHTQELYELALDYDLHIDCSFSKADVDTYVVAECSGFMCDNKLLPRGDDGTYFDDFQREYGRPLDVDLQIDEWFERHRKEVEKQHGDKYEKFIRHHDVKLWEHRLEVDDESDEGERGSSLYVSWTTAIPVCRFFAATEHTKRLYFEARCNAP